MSCDFWGFIFPLTGIAVRNRRHFKMCCLCVNSLNYIYLKLRLLTRAMSCLNVVFVLCSLVFWIRRWVWETKLVVGHIDVKSLFKKKQELLELRYCIFFMLTYNKKQQRKWQAWYLIAISMEMVTRAILDIYVDLCTHWTVEDEKNPSRLSTLFCSRDKNYSHSGSLTVTCHSNPITIPSLSGEERLF